MDGNECEHQDSGNEGARNDDIQRTNFIGDEIGDDAAKDGSSVQHRKKIESEVFVSGVFGNGVELDVEEEHE